MKELEQFNGLHLVASFGLCEEQIFSAWQLKQKKKKKWEGEDWFEVKLKARGTKKQDLPPHWKGRRQHLCFTQWLMGYCCRPG